MLNKESWEVINYYQQQLGYNKAHGNVKLVKFYEIAFELAKKKFSIQLAGDSSNKFNILEIHEAIKYYEQQLLLAETRYSNISEFYKIAIELSDKVIPQQIKLAI